jgi:hypothetical protein
MKEGGRLAARRAKDHRTKFEEEIDVAIGRGLAGALTAGRRLRRGGVGLVGKRPARRGIAVRRMPAGGVRVPGGRAVGGNVGVGLALGMERRV